MRDGRVLLIGYGNPGRLDDGLGPSLADRVEREYGSDALTVDSCYQLSVEQAAEVARYDDVIFVDATVAGPQPYCFQELLPRRAESFSAHVIAPEAVLALARDIFGWGGRGWVLGVRGYEFNEFDERLSPTAEHNLQAAVAFVGQLLAVDNFETFATGPATNDSVAICNGGA